MSEGPNGRDTGAIEGAGEVVVAEEIVEEEQEVEEIRQTTRDEVFRSVQRRPRTQFEIAQMIGLRPEVPEEMAQVTDILQALRLGGFVRFVNDRWIVTEPWR
jgi:hypothetical protein